MSSFHARAQGSCRECEGAQQGGELCADTNTEEHLLPRALETGFVSFSRCASVTVLG